MSINYQQWLLLSEKLLCLSSNAIRFGFAAILG